MKLLEVDDLKVHFRGRGGSMFKPAPVVRAVDGVSFSVERGKTLALVGESGSGKSTTALAVARLAQATAGTVRLGGRDLTLMSGDTLRHARRRVQMVFQDPYSALNPRQRAGDAVRAPLDLMDVGEASQRDARVAELFEAVGLRPEQRHLFPHQFSGGQRQRINIARALASEPDLVICDEPVSALDIAVRAQTLNLLRRLQQQRGISYLFISHDMSVVEYLCDEVAVLYLGQIVERAPREAFFAQPLHPYSVALSSAVPTVRGGRARAAQRIRLEGDPPSPLNPPPGCRFATRCPVAEARCHTEPPALREIAGGRAVRCHLVTMRDGAPVAPLLMPAI